VNINIENIKEFFGTQASHFDISRLNSSFEHIPHYAIYRKRFKRLVDNRHFGRRESIEIFDLLDDLIALSTKENLEKAKNMLMSDIAGRLGTFHIHENKLVFEGQFNQNLVNQSIQGNSAHAFFMKVLLILNKRLRYDQEALDLHSSLNERLNKLVELQKNKGENIQTPQNQTISEFILANSSRIMVDLSKISKYSLDSNVKDSITRHREELDDLLVEEIKALDERVSEALIFLSQLQKLQKSSRAYAEKCRKSLEKMSRDLLSVAYLVSCTEDVVKGKMIHDSELVDNIRLNLFFALTLLPYHDIFSGRYQNALENKLMYLSHLAQYLYSFDIDEIGSLIIPESSEFSVEGLIDVKGKTVAEVFQDLESHLEDRDQSMLWNFFMQIELYFRNNKADIDEKVVLMSLKKLLAQKLLEQRTDKTIRTLYLLKKLVSDHGDYKAADQLFISEDVVLLLRETCHSLEQLLNTRKECVPKIYKKMNAPLLYFQKEKMPKSRYRRMTEGAITRTQAFKEDENDLGEHLDSLMTTLCDVCEKNIERSAGSGLMDKVIREIAPAQGGLLDILDDPDRLRQLMEVPLIKNQSLNRKRLVQLLQLTKTILAK
jgi:hypothetical protein